VPRYGVIAVGWQDSEVGVRAVERAAQLARSFGGRLVAIYVLELALAPDTPSPTDPVLLAERPLPPVEPPPIQTERDRLQVLLRHLDVEAEVVTAEGDPADLIVEIAHERRANLIVIPAPEAGFVDRLLGLDVGDEVGRKASCDVLLVR
jgi:nucleotide-binding universal stress UspA family protein